MSRDFEIEGSVLYGYAGDAVDVSIPDGVVEISAGCMAYSDVETLTIPGSVREIGPRAFSCCIELRRVRIYAGVELICPKAFEECGNLEEVILPNSLQWISKDAFDGCSDNLKIVAPDGLIAEKAGKAPSEHIMFQWEYFSEMRPEAREKALDNAFDLFYDMYGTDVDVYLAMGGSGYQFRHDLPNGSQDFFDPLPPAEIFGVAKYHWEHDQYGFGMDIYRKRDVLFVVLYNDSWRGDNIGFFRYDDFCDVVISARDTVR